jgi:DNA-binding SARP family transcriptional activator
MSSGVKFELLGPVRAWCDGTELQLGSPQQRALLAMLLLARGRQVPLGSMIDGMWGDDEPKAAVGTVRTYISRLRSRLETQPADKSDVHLRYIGDGYMLELGSAVVDVDIFERRLADAWAAREDGEPAKAALLMGNALALWHGGALAGAPGPYAESRRVRLTEVYMTTLEEKLSLDVEAGNHATAIPELRSLLKDHPYREGLSALLMHALYKSSRQAEALVLFDTMRRKLRDELGIDPGPALRTMHQRILRGGEDLMPSKTAGTRLPTILPASRRAHIVGVAGTFGVPGHHAVRHKAVLLSADPAAHAGAAKRQDGHRTRDGD